MTPTSLKPNGTSWIRAAQSQNTSGVDLRYGISTQPDLNQRRQSEQSRSINRQKLIIIQINILNTRDPFKCSRQDGRHLIVGQV